MTKYTYQTATGPVEIGADPYWASILEAEDLKEELNDRKHARPDHKYAPCAPLSLESLFCDGKWFADPNDCIAAAELAVDLERAMDTLTDLQRRYYRLARLEGYKCTEIAKRDGKDPSTVREIVKAAERKVRAYFEHYPRF